MSVSSQRHCLRIRAGYFVNYTWNWHIFLEPNPTGAGTYLDMLLSGLALTIKTALLAWIIALIFGSVIGVLRTLPSKTAS
jgi:glutamate/aspartate transport system permease protein